MRSSSSPTGVVSSVGRSWPKATRHSRRRTAADQSAVSRAAISPTATSLSTAHHRDGEHGEQRHRPVEQDRAGQRRGARLPGRAEHDQGGERGARRGEVAHRSRSRRMWRNPQERSGASRVRHGLPRLNPVSGSALRTCTPRPGPRADPTATATSSSRGDTYGSTYRRHQALAGVLRQPAPLAHSTSVASRRARVSGRLALATQ